MARKPITFLGPLTVLTRNRVTNRPKTCGFVVMQAGNSGPTLEYESQEEATAARRRLLVGAEIFQVPSIKLLTASQEGMGQAKAGNNPVRASDNSDVGSVSGAT